MIKRILIVMAVVAFVAPMVKADPVIDPNTYKPFTTYMFSDGQSDDEALKIDNSQRVFWPFDYKWIEVCRTRIRMKVGMFVRVEDCDNNDKKLVLVQKECDDVGRNDDDWPCYNGCVSFNVKANFAAEIRGRVVDRNEAVFPDGNRFSYSDPVVIPGDGDYHNVQMCVTAWRVAIEKIAASDEVTVAQLSIQARPAV